MLKKIRHEFEELIPPVLYFLVTFNLIAFSHGLVVEGYRYWTAGFVSATVRALLMGKAVLLADVTPFVDRFAKKPLIYNTLWKTGIYTIASLIIQYLEAVIGFYLKYRDLAEANRLVFHETNWTKFWAIHIWLVVLLLIYVAVRELSGALGDRQLRRIFFGG